MYKIYFLLTAVFLVCKIGFSNASPFSSLYSDYSAKFKRETLNKRNATTVQEGDFPDSYTCKNGEVISALFRCDGETDCKDKSDETHELCSEIVCSPYLFSCTYGACISQNKMCDGKQDCVDGSDEDYGLCSSNGNQNLSVVVRQKRQDCNFNCGSGDCISADQLCDGTPHCQDGSDETRAECGNLRCQAYLFRCNYGGCIPKNQVCNGENNCADGSDEEVPGCVKSASDACGNFEFRCKDTTCIENSNICDGTKDCPDGSDETESLCAGLHCASFLYRCAYGACVHKTARCDGKMDCVDGSDEAGCPTTKPSVVTPVTPSVKPPITPITGCLLPQHPQHGRYRLSSGGNYKVNTTVVSNTIITINCDERYTPSQSTFSFCNENRWDPGFPYCIPTCTTIPQSDTYDAQCELEDKKVNCANPLEGTIVRVTCKPYYYDPVSRALPKCINGNWDQSVQPCIPECGRKIVNAQALIIGGNDTQKGEYPWMVAIYNTSTSNKQHICGGSIISRAFVLSAAHCFTSPDGAPQDRNLFTVAAGKYYRDLNTAEPGSQIRKIKELFVHRDYRGYLTKYRDDIALIEVEKFEITLQVQPICVDWKNAYEENDFKEGNKGVVAGWGFTTEGSTPSEVLKKLVVPFRSTDTCREFMNPDFFHQYYSSDKICAGFKDLGTSVCSGDSGGGLFFRSEPTRFFIRALVSVAPRSDAGCDSNHFALFTKVSKYLLWLEDVTRKIP